MSDTTFDPSDLIQAAEQVDPEQVAQSTDYREDGLIDPGKYLNPYREISKIEEKVDPKVGRYTQITLTLTGGLEVSEGKFAGTGPFPYKAWISTKPMQFEGRPGTTTTLAEYMRSVGREVSGVPIRDLLLMLPDTLSDSVNVRIGLTNRGEKLSDGTYSKSELKTKDFNANPGDRKNPKWVFTVTKNGKTFKAQNRVEGFAKVAA